MWEWMDTDTLTGDGHGFWPSWTKRSTDRRALSRGEGTPDLPRRKLASKRLDWMAIDDGYIKEKSWTEPFDLGVKEPFVPRNSAPVLDSSP